MEDEGQLRLFVRDCAAPASRVSMNLLNGPRFHAKTQNAQSPQSKSEGYGLILSAAFACLAPLRETEN